MCIFNSQIRCTTGWEVVRVNIQIIESMRKYWRTITFGIPFYNLSKEICKNVMLTEFYFTKKVKCTKLRKSSCCLLLAVIIHLFLILRIIVTVTEIFWVILGRRRIRLISSNLLVDVRVKGSGSLKMSKISNLTNTWSANSTSQG